MRKILPVLLGLLLLGTLAGLSGSGFVPASAVVEDSRPDTPAADAACAEGSGPGACQGAAADGRPITGPGAPPSEVRFGILAVTDSSRSLAPHTPPPRDVS